jgi:hypothetical protein
MQRTIKIFAGLLVVTAFLAGGCQISMLGGVDQNLVATQSQFLIDAGRATQTAAAYFTQVVQMTEIAGQFTATSTLAPTEGPTSTSTAIPPTETQRPPSATPIPTFTPIPSLTPVPPTATPVPIPCDRASFITDVTIPDGTAISPGATFTKTWRLKNTGTCTWTTSYALIFVGGEQMKASSQIPLGAEVVSGSTVDVSVTFTAPTSEGKYHSSWKIKNASGSQFGTGAKNASFYVDIEVKASTTGYALDFAGSFCNAEWTSGAGTLVCPGVSGDSKGYIQRIDNPVLENGYQDDEPVLLTVPQAQTDGVIRGKFPLYTVRSGDHFQAVLGCVKGAKDCSVKFELSYIIDGESAIQAAGSWVKTYDGSTLVPVDLDLTSLAGKNVRFILTVFANGEMKDDRAQWLAPRIIKP